MLAYAGRYNSSAILSGPEKAAKRIFDISASRGKAVFIQYFFDGSRYGLFKKLFGLEISKTETKTDLVTIGILRILYLYFKYKPEIIHVIAFERFAVMLYLLKLISKVKIIYTIHGIVTFGNYKLKQVPFFYRIKDKICEKIFLRFSDIITLPSEQYTRLLEQIAKIKNNRIRIIPNGCDKIFNEVNRKENISDRLNLFILTDKIGFGEIAGKYESLLPELYDITNIYEIGNGLKNSIKFTGNIHSMSRLDTVQLAELLGSMDIILSLYTYDTFSIMALEAMAAGVIPIITEETGLSDYIKNNVNGFKVNSNDINKIPEIIKSLKNNPGLRSDISRNARKIYDELNWEKIHKMYSEIYNNIK